jgi:hypothetical protein
MFLLGVMSVWLGAVVPGHPRGMIPLPGAAVSSGRAACCATKDNAGHHRTPPRSCAVCQWMATLDVPPAPRWDLGPLGGVIDEVIEAAPARVGLAARYVFPTRGPPVC